MADLKIKWTDLIAEPTTVLTSPAVGDYVLIYDASEPLDTKKIKVISYQNLVNLAAQSALQAIVTGQASGDTFYANGATSIARLAKGAAGQSLRMDSGANYPEWGSPISAYGNISTSPLETMDATSWTDITGASITLAVPANSIVIAIASFHWVKYTGSSCWLRWSIDGTAQLATKLEMQSHQFSTSGAAVGYKSSVSAGSRICKLQYYNVAYTCSISNIVAFALAFSM